MAHVAVDELEAQALRTSLGYAAMTRDQSISEEEGGLASVPPSATVPARAAFALGTLYLLLLLIASRLPAPGGAWATIIAVVVFVYFPLAVIYHGVRIPLGPAMELLSGVISLGVWLGIAGIEVRSDVALTGPARCVALLGACLFFGMLASRVVRDRNLLVPACIIAALADLVSVGWGFTSHALKQTPALVAKLSVAVPALAPQAAASSAKYPILATMGVGDLFFIALFFAAAARFGLPLRRTFCFVFPLVALAMGLTITGVLPWQGVPGLPFIALGFLAANVHSFRFSRQEWRAMGVVSVVLLLMAAGLLIWWRLIA
ncbi:MAG: hypothetical protein FJX75_16745 [Armatimonadetes bacterium]|nr:hypothetical protein [Armatimonadota bacterium]